MAEGRRTRIVIVGGGITGLAAAHAAAGRARETGRAVDVVVLERSDRFGGIVRTEKSGGFVIDPGPDSWVAAKPQATALARELGLAGSLVGTNPATRRYYVVWKGRLHLVPDGLVLGVPTKLRPFVASRLFSWPGKLRMGLESLVPARRFAGDADESIAEFAQRRLGREAAGRLVAPLLGGISAGDATDLSVRAAFPQLVAMESEYGSLLRGMRATRRPSPDGNAPSAFVTLQGGLGDLVGALVGRVRAEGVTLRSGTTVRTLARAGSSWSLTLDRGEMLAAEEILVATPPHVAGPLLGEVDAEAGRLLAAFRCGTTATVFLGYRAAEVAHPMDGSGFVVPRSAGRPILAGTWVSSKWGARAPEGHVLLRVFFGGPWGASLLEGEDSALVVAARAELAALMGLDAEPVLAKTYRFERGSAQMLVGHLAKMRALRERLARVAPGVRVAGGGYEGIGIPDCIRQGHDAGVAMVDALHIERSH